MKIKSDLDNDPNYVRLEETEHCNVKSHNAKCGVKQLRSTIWCLLVTATVLLAGTLTICIIALVPNKSFLFDKGLQYVEEKMANINSQAQKVPDQGRVMSCYYNFPQPNTTGQLMPSDIPPYLCTHINLAFAVVVNKEIKLNDYQYEMLKDINKLKNKNPQLKILLSVGGAGNDRGFPEMVVDHASRKTFIRSIKHILGNYSLDGVDLDWEFPGQDQVGGGGRERQHFSQLLREIRMEFTREKRGYILTLATPAPETIVDVAYDIDQLNEYADYVNIMTYDFHSYSKYTPFTGLNSPLYARPTEHMYLATLNINYTINMYMSKGLDRSKIVVGIPTYAHTFGLVNANNVGIGSPASGFGSLSKNGFINYPDVCLLIKNSSKVTVVYDDAAKVPYLYKDTDWVSYDSPQSVMEKAKFIKDNQLRGAMTYALNADDYDGVCAGESADDAKFPLLRSIRNVVVTDEKNVKADMERSVS